MAPSRPCREKPALLESGISDEAAAAAQAEFDAKQRIINAQAAVDDANAQLPDAQTTLEEAQAALDADPENQDLIAKRDEAQAALDALNQTIADNQAILDEAGVTATPPPRRVPPPTRLRRTRRPRRHPIPSKCKNSPAGALNRPRLCRQHKKSPWAGIFSFSRSGAASAAPLLFCFGCARGCKNGYSGQSFHLLRRRLPAYGGRCTLF